MLVRLLRALTRNPKSFGCGCGSIFVGILVAIIALIVSRCAPSSEQTSVTVSPTVAAEAETPESAPRLILGRLWFDKLPNRRTDSVDLWIFLGGGIGIHEEGSSYRASFDIFEFERQGATIDAKYFHDKKRFKTPFTVKGCEDHEPFNLCLTLDNVSGKKIELYGFAYDDEMERAAPGSKAILEAAKARSAPDSGSK